MNDFVWTFGRRSVVQFKFIYFLLCFHFPFGRFFSTVHPLTSFNAHACVACTVQLRKNDVRCVRYVFKQMIEQLLNIVIRRNYGDLRATLTTIFLHFALNQHIASGFSSYAQHLGIEFLKNNKMQTKPKVWFAASFLFFYEKNKESSLFALFVPETAKVFALSARMVDTAFFSLLRMR